MDLGAPITDVEVAIIEAPEPETNSTDTNSTESDDSSSDSSSTNSSSGNDTTSDSSKKEKKFKLISGGRITAPGYEPIIINKKSFFEPKLLQNKTEE